MEHRDYVDKVMLSELFIKVYGDFFNMKREEALFSMTNVPPEMGFLLC